MRCVGGSRVPPTCGPGRCPGKLSAFRISDDPDSELGGKVLALHARKAEMYPQWGRLLDEIPAPR